MQVSKTLDYAVRSLVHIAQEENSVSTIEGISVKQHIPQSYLAKIMRKLVQRGLLRSSTGPDGGYSLKKQANEISLKYVYFRLYTSPSPRDSKKWRLPGSA